MTRNLDEDFEPGAWECPNCGADWLRPHQTCPRCRDLENEIDDENALDSAPEPE